MAKSAKYNSTIFSTLMDSLLSGEVSLEETESFEDILLYVTSAVAAFCLLAFIFLALKLRKVMIILSVLKSAQVHSSTIPSFVYTTQTSVNSSEKYFGGKINFELVHRTLTLCIMSLLLLIVILANTCKPVRNKTRLIVEITSGNTSAKIILKTPTLCPTYWEIKIPKCVEQITVAGVVTPIVKFEWDEFQVINKLSNQQLYVEICIG